MEERSLVTAATGSLGPVLQKLNTLLHDEYRAALGLLVSRIDIEFIKEKLEPLHSLLLRIWGREDVDTASKNWMIEVRELSYFMEEDIDSFMLGPESGGCAGIDDIFLLAQLKAKVVELLSQCPCRGVFNTLEAMTAATGILGLVLAKLNASLDDGGDKIQEGTTRSDLEFIRSKLKRVQSFLPKIWDREVLDAQFEHWMLKTKEQSNNLKRAMDKFMILPECDDVQQANITSAFQELKRRAKDLSAWCREKFSKCSRSSMNPRSRFLHKDASELVGMEGKKDELMRLLLTGDEGAVQRLNMVCIVGFAGMGKTTLADLVYDAVGEQFQCRAFVSVSLRPDMVQVLSSVLREVTNGVQSEEIEAATEQDLVDSISNFLSDKRYLIVIDDIWHWEDWEVVRKALPNNHLGCKIIMTTRIRTVAWKCRTEQGARVYGHNFSYEDGKRIADMRLNKCIDGDMHEANVKGLSTAIVDMCGGLHLAVCPLAVICLSSAWAESQVQGDHKEWATQMMMDRFLSTPALQPLVQRLCLGFDDLPVQLRTCLLYCSMYPQYHEIAGDWLARKWIAEGFVSQEEVAEAYFDELASRNLLQPLGGNLYAIHPLMLAFLVCKAKEDKFVACKHNNGPGSSLHPKQIRCLSLCMNRYLDNVSHTRSLAVGHVPLLDLKLDGVPFKEFKSLRLLDIGRASLENGHLVDICGLTSLRYLGLMSCGQIRALPREIGRLQNLETLDVKSTGIGELPNEEIKLQHLVWATNVKKLPKEILELQHLRTLNVHDTEFTELPKEITKLELLENLDVSYTAVKVLPKEIGKLHQLRTLNISNTNFSEIPKEIEELQHLRRLNISFTNVKMLPKEIEKLQHLRALNISGTEVEELPGEITKLELLEDLNISYTGVRELPKEFKKLQQLRTLDIRRTKIIELPCREVPNSFLNVAVGCDIDSGHQVVKSSLGVLSSSYIEVEEAIISSSGANCRDSLSTLVLFNHVGTSLELFPLPMHRVAGRHMSVPQWVKQDLNNVISLDIRLYKLGEGDLEFLKEMPNLQALVLRFEVLQREPIAITGGGFSKLEKFYVDCRMPRVTFKEGAMPILKHLEFKFYSGLACQDYYMGILHLPKLEKIVFRCSEYHTSDGPGIRVTIDVVRKEAVEHPNEIILCVNDKYPEVFRSGATWISLADMTIIKKQFEERKTEIEKREQEIEEKAARILERRIPLLRAAEGRAQQDKRNARAAIEKEVQEKKNILEKMEQELLKVEKEAQERKNILEKMERLLREA